MQEKLDQYCELNRMYHFEGESGVRKFEKLLKDVTGYGRSYADTFREFLADNPGAITALIEWIGEQDVPEWNSNIADCVDFEEEEN